LIERASRSIATSVTLDRYDLSCRTYEPAQQHRYVSDARAKIQDAVPGGNSGFAEEPLRNWREAFGLSDQALVLRVRAAKYIISVAVIQRYTMARYYHCLLVGVTPKSNLQHFSCASRRRIEPWLERSGILLGLTALPQIVRSLTSGSSDDPEQVFKQLRAIVADVVETYKG
jgi:hypothetical protein